MRTLTLVAVLCAATAAANPELEKANRLLFDQKYDAAAKALEAANKVPNNPREVVLRIYEMQGIVYGQLNQSAKAKEAFQSWLSLDSSRELKGKYSSKVTAAFNAAKDWSNTNSPLDFKSAKAGMDDKAKVIQLAAKVKSDAMRLTRKVRFHLKADEGKWVTTDSEIQGAYAAAATDAMGVEWWAELLGDHDKVLMLIGSEAEPLREGKAKDKPAAVAEAPKKDPVKVAEVVPPTDEKRNVEAPEEVVRGEPVVSSGPLRPLGYGLMGAGLVGVAVGAIFGVQANGSRAKVLGAETKDGVVTGLTQKDAFALEAQSKSQATIANVLLFGGAALAVGGGICWLAGGSSSEAASVSVAPTAGGVVVSGGF